MALTQTPAGEMGWPAAEFGLPGVDGRDWSVGDLRGVRGLVLFFICNHCPYVKAVADRLALTGAELQRRGYGVAAICSNDPVAYPEDDFEHMAAFARQHEFPFPYLHDESQAVARTYGAVCTPDIFAFDAMLTLRYRGRLDSAGKAAAGAETVPELLDALTLIERTGHGPEVQHASIGCSIKWKAA
ncbi:thioredoxin family protein [Pontivivens ytuae]|uniref:Thioredoxin family protein n=1 Tax=Pontivivens ytuae TaxID=2789856 RepID=A0A7S9QCM3_9RHOB|nr:thioredoxin family protein [Pontivivens ytuae]QPH54378.1 thioredoxin family protein [Pontivivens ytuae]